MKNSKVGFRQLLVDTETEAAITEKAVRELEDKLHKAEKELEHKKRDVMRLKKIEGFKTWEERKPYTWNFSEMGKSDYNKYAWKEVRQFFTTMLDFTVVIHERTDVKLKKFVVDVYGSQETLPIYSWRGGDRYINYVTDKYKGEELTKAFKTVEEARKFADDWMLRLVDNHIGEVEFERELLEDIKPGK